MFGNAAHAINMYQNTRKSSILTQSKAQLVVTVYDELLVALDATVDLIHQGRKDSAALSIDRCQDLIQKGLLNYLDTQGNEVGANLALMYTYWCQELAKANLHQNDARVLEVKEQVADLRDAWKQLVAQGY